jgi:hypothetical protein
MPASSRTGPESPCGVTQTQPRHTTDTKPVPAPLIDA